MDFVVYLNGEFKPLSEAKISVMDRGFLFGDGVYEVIPVYRGKIFRLPEHIQRLDRSLAETRIKVERTEQDWLVLFEQIIERNGLQSQDSSLYVQVTRGAAEKRDHAFPQGAEATIFAMATPANFEVDLSAVEGISVITLPDNRWTRCNIKSICLLPNVLLKQQALDDGVMDVILIRDGRITEAAAANVFVVKDGVVATPPRSILLLGGITRDLIVELSVNGAFECQEREISEQELLQADEVWITSSTREIMPVLNLNGKPVGEGKIGPIWYNVAKCFQAYKASLI